MRAPVALWHDEQGGLVPTAHVRWLADAIPGAELRLFAGEGALPLIFGHASEIIGWLAEQGAPARRWPGCAAAFAATRCCQGCG